MTLVLWLKWSLIAVLVLAGAAFLFIDAGGSIPFIKYGQLEAHSLPTGIGFLVAAIGLAYFWRVEVDHEVTETWEMPDGTTHTSSESTRYKAEPPSFGGP